MDEVEKDPKLWFKPCCKVCGLVFNSYNEYIDHCASKHWRTKSS